MPAVTMAAAPSGAVAGGGAKLGAGGKEGSWPGSPPPAEGIRCPAPGSEPQAPKAPKVLPPVPGSLAAAGRDWAEPRSSPDKGLELKET